MEALECLQRAFEVTISYCTYYKGWNVLDLRYDTELLVTGKKSKKSLAEKYQEEKAKNSRNIKENSKTTSKKDNKVKQIHKMKTKKEQKGMSVFWIFVAVSLCISMFILLFISALSQ